MAGQVKRFSGGPIGSWCVCAKLRTSNVCINLIVAGIYIHIPFCNKACHYCDFHFSTDQRYRKVLIESICAEIDLRAPYLNEAVVETIYFGGGTPSLLTEAELQKIFVALQQTFPIKKGAEITLEANPEDISREKISFLREMGVNRLSIGIQSFQDETLQKLNRSHSGKQAAVSLEIAQEGGLSNLNADLIFAIPGRSMEQLKEDVSTLLRFQPKHISAYGLTIEEKTVFGKWSSMGKFKAVSDEDNANEFEYLMSTLPEAGLEQYEISNYAMKGFESKHNSSYWRQVPYLGLGPGAHSFDGKSRQINISNNAGYMSALQDGKSFWTTEVLTQKDHLNEYLLTSLRTREGCSLDYLERTFNHNLWNLHQDYLQNLMDSGKIMIKNHVLFLTPSGKLIADEITRDVFVE